MQNNINHSQRAHALLSASGADRWINCTPSARLGEKVPEKGSIYAEEGTLAHELCELRLLVLIKGEEVRKRVDKAGEVAKIQCEKNEWDYGDMVTHAITYSDYVMKIYNQAKLTDELAKLIVEESVPTEEWTGEKGGKGTVDATIIANGTLHVIDYKYGQGIKVSPAENSQLKMYGLGSLRMNELCYDIDNVELHVVQPRLGHIESWKVSTHDLEGWGETVVKPKAILAYAGEGKCNAGKWCKFCKVKPTCRAAKDAAFKATELMFEEPKLLTDSEIAFVLTQAEYAQDWLGAVQDYALTEAVEDRKKFDGWKVVEGKSNRKWTDEEKVSDTLSLNYGEGEYINKKLKGIGDIEKLVGKKEFPSLLGDYVIKPQGKPTLVPASDKRQEWAKISDNDFKD